MTCHEHPIFIPSGVVAVEIIPSLAITAVASTISRVRINNSDWQDPPENQGEFNDAVFHLLRESVKGFEGGFGEEVRWKEIREFGCHCAVTQYTLAKMMTSYRSAMEERRTLRQSKLLTPSVLMVKEARTLPAVH
jgi:hypothetical protein